MTSAGHIVTQEEVLSATGCAREAACPPLVLACFRQKQPARAMVLQGRELGVVGGMRAKAGDSRGSRSMHEANRKADTWWA